MDDYPRQPGGSQAPTPSTRQHPQDASARASAKQIALMVLGVILGFSAFVFPWTAWHLGRARAAGKTPATSWVVGAIVSGVVTFAVAGLFVLTAFVPSEVDDAADTSVRVAALVTAAIGGVALVVGARMILAGTHGSGSRAQRQGATRIDSKLFDDSEYARRVEAALRTLSSYVPMYAGYHIAGRPVSERIETVVRETHELIRRLDARGTPQQVRMTAAQYADTLEKLVACTSKDYLKDIIDNPRLWHDPAKRVGAVASALDAVSEQVLENIRQVNARTDLNFQVAVASLQTITQDEEFAALYNRGH